jgi:hypothetical protein
MDLRSLSLLGSVAAPNIDVSLAGVPPHCDLPRIATDLAVLDECPLGVRLDVDVSLFAAVRARDVKL